MDGNPLSEIEEIVKTTTVSASVDDGVERRTNPHSPQSFPISRSSTSPTVAWMEAEVWKMPAPTAMVDPTTTMMR